jgi:hypothetical protein
MNLLVFDGIEKIKLALIFFQKNNSTKNIIIKYENIFKENRRYICSIRILI